MLALLLLAVAAQFALGAGTRHELSHDSGGHDAPVSSPADRGRRDGSAFELRTCAGPRQDAAGVDPTAAFPGPRTVTGPRRS